MGACGGLIAFFAVLTVAAWILMVFLRWLFCRAVVVAGDAKLISECTKCRYSLAGLGTSPTCPECNTNHPSIYTTQQRTEWHIRTELLKHWFVAALLCLAIWGFFAYAFPLIATAIVYWSKSWSAAGRIQQLLESHRYPWLPSDLAFTIVLGWFAACALSLRCRIRTLCIVLMSVAAVTTLASVIDALVSKNWQGDWFSYFWQADANLATATIGTLSVLTLVCCALIDAMTFANRSPTQLPLATDTNAPTSPVLTSDSAASPHTQSPRPPSPGPACSPPSTQ